MATVGLAALPLPALAARPAIAPLSADDRQCYLHMAKCVRDFIGRPGAEKAKGETFAVDPVDKAHDLGVADYARWQAEASAKIKGLGACLTRDQFERAGAEVEALRKAAAEVNRDRLRDAVEAAFRELKLCMHSHDANVIRELVRAMIAAERVKS